MRTMLFNEVSNCSEVQISKILKVQKEGTQMMISKCGQSFTLT